MSVLNRPPAERDFAAQALYQPGQRILGRYLVRERIGGGPLGFVFRAEELVSGVSVAVKVLWPEMTPDDGARGLFALSATKARGINSRYVAGVSDAFVDVVGKTTVCVVVGPFQQRPTLASRIEERLRSNQPMLPMEAQPIVSQLGVGLSAIHAAGLVHGNLKARNIFLPQDEVQIADVGVAGALSPVIVAFAQASLGRDKGRAPEAAAGAPWHPAADIYAFGVIVGQMMGMFPPSQEHAVPAAISDVVWRALAENPQDRFADVDAFAAALLTTFERGERQSLAGLRAISPPVGNSAAAGVSSGGEDFASVTGALDVTTTERGLVTTPAAPRRAPSVFVDEAPVDSLTPVTMPPSFQVQPGGAPVAGSAQAPAMTTPAPATSNAETRTRVRVPFPLILLLSFATASLALAILYNVVDLRFDPRAADKVPVIKRLHDDHRGGGATSPATGVSPGDPATSSGAPASPGALPAAAGTRLPVAADASSGGMGGAAVAGGGGGADGRAAADANDADTGRNDDASSDGGVDGPGSGPATAGSSPRASAVSPPAVCGPSVKKVTDGASFCIAAFEYPAGRQRPRVGVTLAQARALCAARGQRLCRQREWETACRGEAASPYPYGPRPLAEACNTVGRAGTLARAGSFRRCRTPSGAFDMVGNVAEWVEEGAIKGGDVKTSAPQARCDLTRAVPATFRSPTVGFRCCADLR